MQIRPPDPGVKGEIFKCYQAGDRRTAKGVIYVITAMGRLERSSACPQQTMKRFRSLVVLSYK